MKNPYTRTATPVISYVGLVAERACFRLHLRKEEALNGLLYRGEIIEFLLKEGITHKIGNDFAEVRHLENERKADFFILIDREEIGRFADSFEVSGFLPVLVD